MSHSPANETRPTATDRRAERLVRPESSIAEPPADLPQGENENRGRENSPLLYPDASYNVRDFISREDNELPDKSYGDGTTNEICAFKWDQGKIDEPANDYRAEMCVSSGRGSAIQKESYEETVKSDGTLSRNEDESRCKSNRKRKTRRGIYEGVIIDFGNDVYGNSHSGIKISVISTHNLAQSEMKFVAVPKDPSRSSTFYRTSGRKMINKMIGNPVLAVFCAENCGKTTEAGKSTKRKCKNYQRKSMDEQSHSDVNTIVTYRNVPKQLRNILKEQRELHRDNSLQSYCPSNEILDSTKCCHHDDALVDIDYVRYPVLNAEQTYVGARKRNANYCCSIFNDKHQEYHICDRQDYNADGSDFNAEMQADWTAECFHPEYTRARGCRCFYDSSEYHTDINMQRDCYPLMPTRAARVFKNSAPSRKHQREELERFGSDELRADVAPKFATEADEYSADRVELGCNRCSNRENRGLTSASRKCAASKASVTRGGSAADLRDSRSADASRCEIGMRPGKEVRHDDEERPNKSDSLKTADTWDAHARWNDCIGRRCDGGRVVAESSRSGQSHGEKSGFARGVDSKWKSGSIETDAQQLDYKWKRKIATVDAGTRASVNFKGERDSRYKSDEAIRVQLRENVKIRKRESLQMVEATSQTRNDNTNVDGKRCETRDYSLWPSLQMGKIWSQMRDACKNVVKLATTSVCRFAKDASKSERLQRNPVEVANATLVENSSSCADKICGETYRKNLTRSKSEEKSESHQERTIGNVEKYHEDTEATARKNPQAAAPSRHEHKRDGYRDIVEFLPRNDTCGHDGNVQPQSHLTESLMYLEDSVYPRLRNRGGSDNNRDFARSTEDKQKSLQRVYEETRSTRYYRKCASKKCACCNRIQKSRCADDQSSQDAVVRYELSVTTDHRVIRANVPDVSRNNSLHHELQSTSVSLPKEDNKQREARATSEQTTSREKMEPCENAECAETERSLLSEIAEIADTTVSSTKAGPMVHTSRYDANEPVASTSKWEAPPVSPGKSRGNRPGFRSPFRGTAMKFWRKRPRADNKTIAPLFKRNRRSIGRRRLSAMVAATHDSGTKITQIEPSTVQTAREGNKRRTYVNIQMQTADAIVTRILSEFLVNGEKKKKKRVLMSITVQSESDHNVSDRREAETQTPSNDVTFMGIDGFGYSNERPRATITTASKTVQCFVCDKPNCYEIKQSDNSITLEEALIAEYAETSELSDHFAERRTDIEIPP